MRLSVLCLLLLMLLPTASDAARRSEIALTIPAFKGARGDAKGVIYLKSVSDNRTFADNPREANTPSIAVGSVATTPAKERRFFIARVRDGYGKARNNIFLKPDQPVEKVVRELLTDALASYGYRVVGDAAAAGPEAIVMEVAIDQLWGYIQVKGGGWSGDIPKMAGEIKTTLITRGPGGKGRFEVSGTALHRFTLMTAGHWVKMFEELFGDYQKNLGRVRF
ncbi:hypothetical protein JCM30471_01670 [Desulfuromonas carbonis]